MRMLGWRASACITLLILAGSATAAHGARACSAPQELTRFRVKLPNTARAVRSRSPLDIVAIGSSSTAGVGASDPAHTYPARLAEELQLRWPQLITTVHNKGVSGELAYQMLERFQRDVVPYHPQLVIWQTGSNQLLRSETIGDYVETIREGIGRLRAARADVVLMDPQFAPRVVARRMHLSVVDAIAAAGTDMNVAVFQRFAVMRHWVSSGQYKMEEIISSDGLHMNDLSYGCLARLLADSLVAASVSENENRQEIEKTKDVNR